MLDELLKRYPVLMEIKDDITKAVQEIITCYENGGKVLIPNIPAFVNKVDKENKKIYITPIQGLIDDEI